MFFCSLPTLWLQIYYLPVTRWPFVAGFTETIQTETKYGESKKGLFAHIYLTPRQLMGAQAF